MLHSHVQELQHKALVVGQTDYRFGMSKLPKEELAVYTFLNGNPSFNKSSVLILLSHKQVPDDIKHGI